MALTERQKQFIKFYVESGKPRDAAIRAGYAPKNASGAAADLLKRNQFVMKALQDIREGKDKPKGEYNLEAAMAEADEAIQIAKATENAASFLAAVKLKAQLMKILDDRPAGAAFQIVFSGIDDNRTVVSVVPPKLTGSDEPESGS